MSKVLIVGAAGKVGRRLCRQLAERDHQILAMHRKPEQAKALRQLGADPVFGDLLQIDVDGLAKLMAGCDAVVFSAGAGGAGMELTNAVDGRGLELAVQAAESAGVPRFLLVSAFPESRRDKETSEGFENYIKVKKQSEAYLTETDLRWVVVRPGTLLDDPGTGSVRAGFALPYGAVPRDDVAAVLAELIETPSVRRAIVELTAGDTPIAEAIKRFIRP